MTTGSACKGHTKSPCLLLWSQLPRLWSKRSDATVTIYHSDYILYSLLPANCPGTTSVMGLSNVFWLAGTVYVEKSQSGVSPREDVHDSAAAEPEPAPGGADASWGCYAGGAAIDALIAFLNPAGLRENALRRVRLPPLCPSANHGRCQHMSAECDKEPIPKRALVLYKVFQEIIYSPLAAPCGHVLGATQLLIRPMPILRSQNF